MITNLDNIEYITLNCRDGKIIDSQEEWSKLLQQDIDKENEMCICNIAPCYYYSDLDNGREVDINHHIYKYKTICKAHTAKDIFNAMIEEGMYDELFEALNKVDESIIRKVIEQIPSIRKIGEEYIVEIN